MRKSLLSKEAFATYSAFFVNIAAAIFITIFVSKDFLDLFARLIGSIITLYFAILLERRFK